MAKKDDFNRDVLLPPGLTVTAIQKAIEYIEKPKPASGRGQFNRIMIIQVGT